jgi:monoamine oxidase
MERVFPGTAAHVERGASWCWETEQWSRGAFAAYSPGQMLALYPHLSQPHGRIHLAGEHASIWPGWMQGALSSGLRAAKQIAQLA